MARKRQRPPVNPSSGFLQQIGEHLELTWRLMLDPRVGLASKLLPPIALAYLLSPIDLMPDVVPLLTQLDDLGILLLGLKLFISLAPRHVVEEHVERIRRRASGPPRSDKGFAGGGPVIDGQYRYSDEDDDPA